MIQAQQATNHHNKTIYTMTDAGAIFYEIDTDNGPIFFDTMNQAKTFIDNAIILNKHSIKTIIRNNRLYAVSVFTTRNDNRSHYSFTDVTNYNDRQLFDYLGY